MEVGFFYILVGLILVGHFVYEAWRLFQKAREHELDVELEKYKKEQLDLAEKIEDFNQARVALPLNLQELRGRHSHRAFLRLDDLYLEAVCLKRREISDTITFFNIDSMEQLVLDVVALAKQPDTRVTLRDAKVLVLIEKRKSYLCGFLDTPLCDHFESFLQAATATNNSSSSISSAAASQLEPLVFLLSTVLGDELTVEEKAEMISKHVLILNSA